MARPHRPYRPLPPFARLRWQIPTIFVFCAVLPGALFDPDGFWNLGQFTSSSNAFCVAAISSAFGLFLFRRLGCFPGISSFGQIAPSVAGPYLVALVAILLLRLDYSRPILLASAMMAILVFSCLWLYGRRKCAPTLYVVPNTRLAIKSSSVKIVRMQEPPRIVERNGIVVVDLRQELEPRWEEFLLNSALAGIPVFHAKLLQESLSGQVEIEHLSENSFGSVLPNPIYLKTKRIIDVTGALLILPLLILPWLLIALAIRLEGRGSVLYRQTRMGYRGETFQMVKFRTMRVPEDDPASGSGRDRMRTLDRDPRITGVGRFLRRSRLDELPQIVNIIRGQMSWIGPRPEACELAEWYQSEIAFYGYRHMVRPGITGWAQVSQGHVHDIPEVRHKLYYDFYYIKYFSAWLDALIVLRTLRVLLFGQGAR